MSWKTHPTTPAQVNKFFDACVQHILTDDAETAECVIVESVQRTDDAVGETSLGVTDEEVALAPQRPCVFGCGRYTTRTVVGNPFCRAHMVVMCDQCSR